MKASVHHSHYEEVKVRKLTISGDTDVFKMSYFIHKQGSSLIKPRGILPQITSPALLLNFETGSKLVRLSLNLQSTCLSSLYSCVTGMHHYAQLCLIFYIRSNLTQVNNYFLKGNDNLLKH